MNRVIDAFFARLPPHQQPMDPSIHPRDSMFRWGLKQHRGYHEMAILDYFRSGLSAYRTAREILDWRFGDAMPEQVLDFGSGFGRLIRFLVCDLPASRLWAAEIDPEAVEHQRQRYGVQGLRSTSDPVAFAPFNRLASGSFDALFAFSVLSHLPPERFESWLRAWIDLLAEGGVLAFSVFDEATLLPGRRMTGEGFHFEEMSESEDLDLKEYGTAYVTEAFVSRALAAAGGGRLSWHRFRRGLWHIQDLYVVLKGEAPQPLPLLELQGEPTGRLETCALEYGAQGEAVISLAGWAVGHGSRLSEVEVELALGGEPVACVAPVERRPDVLEIFSPGSRSPLCGWAVRHRAPADAVRPQDLLVVSARCLSSGVESLLHLGSVETTCLYIDLLRMWAKSDRYEAQAKALAGQVEIFERSGFGKLRRRWMGLKRRVGLDG
jgi:SAM-dependent methyltransferase